MRCEARMKLATLLPLLLGLSPSLAVAQAGTPEPGPEVTSGGYMQTTLPDGQGVPLPLKHTAVEAEVAGFVASVQVTQTFTNPYDRPIEAVYVFPLPERSAVHAMTMYLGKRVIRGTIQKREEARQLYEAAKAAGKTAALLDQERPNLFTQSVANILPREEIKVELSYVEDLKYQHGEYEFVFPMVVGPRFIAGTQAIGRQGTGWAPDTDQVPDASRITPPLLPPGMRAGHDIMVRVKLDAGMALEKIHSPTHQVKLERPDTESAAVALLPADTVPNKDFVLRYTVAGQRPKIALLTEKDQRSGYFLLMIQPRLPDAQYPVAPREYVFVLDTSGSMHGFPLERSKEIMRACLTQVTKRDTFQIVTFAGSASFLFPKPQPATPQVVEEALAGIGSLRGGGGTQFIPALDLTLNAPRDPGRARVVLFLSDGYIGYENEVLRYLRSNLRGANLFPLGVGSSVNRFLIEGMARIGQGEPFVLLPRDNAAALVQRFHEYVSRPSLTDIEVDWGGLDVQEATPAYLADLFAERPLFVVGRYERGGKAKIRVTGRYAGEPYAETLEVDLPAVNHGLGAGISYLWARRTIGELMDVHRIEPARKQEVQEAVTSLALQFHLMSEFTSFVAVDEQVRTDRPGETVAVPVPLPEGVSPLAAPPGAFVGGAATPASTPMPSLAPSPAMPMRKIARKPMMMLDAAPESTAVPSGSLGIMGTGKGGGGGMAMQGLGAASTATRGYGGSAGRPAAKVSAGDSDAPRHEVKKPEARVVLAPEGIRRADGGAVTPELRQAVEQLLPRLLPAYQKALQSDGYAKGLVVLRLELDAAGKVTRSSVTSAPFGGKTFRDELIQLLLTWTLGAGRGQILTVTLRFG